MSTIPKLFSSTCLSSEWTNLSIHEDKFYANLADNNLYIKINSRSWTSNWIRIHFFAKGITLLGAVGWNFKEWQYYLHPCMENLAPFKRPISKRINTWAIEISKEYFQLRCNGAITVHYGYDKGNPECTRFCSKDISRIRYIQFLNKPDTSGKFKTVPKGGFIQRTKPSKAYRGVLLLL